MQRERKQNKERGREGREVEERERIVPVFPPPIESCPRPAFLVFLMAGASDLLLLIAIDAFQLYP